MRWRMGALDSIDARTSAAGLTSGASGVGGLLGLHNVCHALCTSAIGALAVVGIAVNGMPLASLQSLFSRYAVLFLAMGFASTSLGAYLLLRHYRRCGGFRSRWDYLNIILVAFGALALAVNAYSFATGGY